MAEKELPRIATATEKSAFASEESYFVLETINESIKKMDFSLNLKLGSIAMMLGEFFEMNVRAMERQALLANNDQTAPGAKGKTDPMATAADEGEGIGWGGLITAGLAAMAVGDLNLNKYIEGSGLLSTIFGGITKAVKGLELTKKVTTFLEPVKNFFTRVGRLFGVIGNVTGLKAFGLLSKIGSIFPFVRVFSGIISFVQGFLAGYDKEGLFGGFKEGFAKLAENFLGWPINFLKDGLAWLLEKFGVLSPEQKQQFNDFDFIKIIGDGVRAAFDWFKMLFTDPAGAMKTLWQAYVGAWTNIGNFIYDYGVKPVIDWIKKVFAWAGDIASEGWTSLSEFVSTKWSAVKQWFSDKLTWAAEGIAGGWTSLSGFVKEKWDAIKAWFGTALAWGADTVDAGFNLASEVGNKIKEIKDKVVGIFLGVIETVSTGFQNFADYLSTIPKQIELYAREKFIELQAKLQKGFAEFAAWFASIPAQISLVAQKLLYEKSGGWLGSEEGIAEAQAKVDAQNTGLEETMAAIDAETSRRLATLETERQALAQQQQAANNTIINNVTNNVNNGGNTNTSNATVVGGDTTSGDPRPDRF